MVNVTFSLPDALKARMSKHDEVRWSRVVSVIIERKLDELERLDKIASRSKFMQEDAIEIGRKVNKGMGLHARKLLNENSN